MYIQVSGQIARHVRNRVSSLGYKAVDDKSKPEQLHTLKDRVSNGPGDVRILNTNRFQISLSETQFNQTLKRELFDGIVRIRQIEKSALALSANNTATAWQLTTCYYASFFAAIEILRCSGVFVSYFHDEAIRQVKQRSVSIFGVDLEPGTYVGSAELNQISGGIVITFAKKHFRHHEETWQQLKRIVVQTKKKMTGTNAIHQEQFEKFIGNDASPFWPSPSDTRNHWNYEDAALFGIKGEAKGTEFRKLAGNKFASLKWGGQTRPTATIEACASAVAFMMNALICATEELSNTLLPESLSKLLPKTE